jgi:hypothetical protein
MNPTHVSPASIAPTLAKLGIPTTGWQSTVAQLHPGAHAYTATDWHVELVPTPTPWPGPELAAYALGKVFLATDLAQVVVVCGAPTDDHPAQAQLMELRHTQEAHLHEKVLYCVWFGA